MSCTTSNYNYIAALFNAVYIAEFPSRFTFRFLQSLGFKSSKMRDLIVFLRDFGFLDGANVPTSLYTEFKKAPDPVSFVSTCAKHVYAGLVPQINSLEMVSLKALFSEQYPSLDSYQSFLAVKTFLAINAYAPFYTENPKMHSPSFTGQEAASKRSLTININLPETENARVYEAIFRHLKEILH